MRLRAATIGCADTPDRRSYGPKLRKAKPSAIGIVTADDAGLIKCEVASPSIDRFAITLSRVVRAASLQGFELVAADGSARFESETEAIGFSIAEAVRRQRHLLTDAERAKEEAWERGARNLGLIEVGRRRVPSGCIRCETEHVCDSVCENA